MKVTPALDFHPLEAYYSNCPKGSKAKGSQWGFHSPRDRKGSLMTTTITNAQAIANLIAFARENGYSDEATIAKAEKHLGTMRKPSKTEGNLAILPEVVAFLAENPDGCTAKEILEQFPQLRSTSKVVAICRLGVERGEVSVSKPEKGASVYIAA